MPTATSGVAISVVSGRWVLATLVAGFAYVLAYTQEWTLFNYYPMVGEFHWQAMGDDLGPRITYYGWKAIGVLAGAAILLLPAHWFRLFSGTTLWYGLLGLVGLIGAHEAHWFLS